jgi:uncharacterized protein
MYRKALQFLDNWLIRKTRKPLVIRGARQTGKSTLIRIFAEKQNLALFEINFEENDSYSQIFNGNDPISILQQLEIKFGKKIIPGKSIVFLDEIQASPAAFTTLRYFHEKKPGQAVIAAGSLLELVLKEKAFSVPVGRIEYCFLGPMTFEEYLLAAGKELLLEFFRSYTLEKEIPPSIHAEGLTELRNFTVLGGMPEVVNTWIETKSMLETDVVKHAIFNTLRDDLHKYRPNIDSGILISTLSRFPNFVGKKIVYSKLHEAENTRNTHKSLRILELARIIYGVSHTAGNGVPLGAEQNPSKQKGLFIDCGLLNTSLGLTLIDFPSPDSVIQVQNGIIAEQFTGQHLLYQNDFYKFPELWYWSREKSQSSAEVDFLVSKGRNIIPVEVKAGKTGTLRSLHSFMQQKKYPDAVRFYTGPPQSDTVTTSIPGEKHSYRLLSLPLYLIEQYNRLLKK